MWRHHYDPSAPPLIPDWLATPLIFVVVVVWVIVYTPWWLLRRLRDPNAV